MACSFELDDELSEASATETDVAPVPRRAWWPSQRAIAVGSALLLCAAAGAACTAARGQQASRRSQHPVRALWDSQCDGVCANNQTMVYHSWWAGCVCQWCETNSFSQIQLCRRKCYVGDSPMCAQCFPSAAEVSVQLEDGTVATRAMERLRVGDHVLTLTGFSKVFAFMDHAVDTESEYVQFETASGHRLSLTADHIVFAGAEKTPVLAESVAEGDLLWTAAGARAEFAPSRVVGVRRALERGMHAPLTLQGSVVVNGVLSSSYAKARALRWGNRTLMSGHDLGKALHEPLRIACGQVPSLCGEEWHSPEGRHAWTQLILDNFGWLQAMNQDHSDLRAALLVEPSVGSLLAGLAQIGGGALLRTTFGEGSPFPWA